MILFVDNDEAYEILMPHFFEKSGWQVSFIFLQDGEQAIDYLSGKDKYADRSKFPLPKMVLLDLKMPKVDGFEVLEWKSKQPQLAKLPVVVWSSSNLKQDKERAASLGAVDYIVKPIIGHELIEAIERIYKTLTEARSILT